MSLGSDVISPNIPFTDAALANCSPPAVGDFPWDGLTRAERQQGYVALHAMAAAYLFGTMAIICHKYFVPSVHLIAKRLGVSDDVAGATAMAAATSSPELFVSSVATFTSDTEADTALGTIIGSAVFNVLAVPAACGLFSAGKVIELNIWPITREVVAYAFSIITLLAILADRHVWWYESLFMVCFYFSYMSGLCCIGRKISCCNTKPSRSLYDGIDDSASETDTLCGAEQEAVESATAEDITLNKEIAPCGRVCNFIMKPAQIILFLTIPNCQQKHWESFYPITFIMCIAWLAVTSYLATWMITVIGDTINIPDSIVGLTLLAIGTSLPEAMSSIIVTRQGRGAMGITNAVGSNTFNILLCLGLPWLLKTTVLTGGNGAHQVNISSGGLLYSTVSLLVTLLMFYICLACFDFQLCSVFGTILLIFYIVFLVLASLVELNIFFPVNLPVCDR
ncbi:sodium/potassium/calcium exchanger 3-like isoform X1 [Schistocerca nitens]|uniref:sodium/potassium/calcium exchanger 3-like isoform X1 n=2 Tax=Schistocerca nitens TaxID=7011 RepID=UPI002119AD4B|nr:sodium/potassium/calcium exchanger 3-like isoform X1 [Schistocerca nitens]